MSPRLVSRSRAIARPLASQKRIMVHFCRQSGGALREQGLAAGHALPLAFADRGHCGHRVRTLVAARMAHRKKLLAAGIAAIALVALAPYARDYWNERQAAGLQAQRAQFIERKNREIACLERLARAGLAQGSDVQAEIARCRALSLDPVTGEPARDPG